MTPAPPQTRDEIIAAFAQQEADSLAYWNAFESGAFFQPIGASWSPADTVRHLIKSTRPVVRALGLPRIVLRVLFGRPRCGSVSYDELRRRYLAALADGGQAGSYAPTPRTAPDAAAWRRDIMRDFAAVNAALRAATARWTDAALDTAQLPHPFAGKFTIREMLFFTLYHQRHHIAVIERRQAGWTIRAATGQDAEALSLLAERTFRDTFSATNAAADMDAYCAGAFGAEIQRRELVDPATLTLIVDGNGGPVGYAQLLLEKGHDSVDGRRPAELKRFYVDRAFHGSPLAAALMRATEERARAAGADVVWLGVWERNPRAIRFYEKSGYRAVGEHVFVVGSDPQRDLVMSRRLE